MSACLSDQPLVKVKDSFGSSVNVPIPLSTNMDCTLGLKKEAHMYEARALPHYQSHYVYPKYSSCMCVGNSISGDRFDINSYVVCLYKYVCVITL